MLQKKKEDALILSTAEKYNEEGSEPLNKILRIEKDVNVSGRTVRRRLKNHRFSYGSPIQKALLTVSHKKVRFKWAKKNQNTDCSNVIFSDESMFHLRATKIRSWNRKGHPKIVKTTKGTVELNV